MNRRTILQAPLLAGAVWETALLAAEAELTPLGDLPGELRFGVMGDSGAGTRMQRRLAQRMTAWHASHPWAFVAMLGDNIYENGEAAYFDSKFVNVYRDLLDQGVPFRAALGNHDVRSRGGREMVQEEAFGFVGRESEYEFMAGPVLPDGKRLARFICLDTPAWVEAIEGRDDKKLAALKASLKDRLNRCDQAVWNIFYFHHPIHAHTKGSFLFVPRGHGSTVVLQEFLEPEIREYADLVLAGHDHFYQKIKPQHGVHHFVSGAAGKVRGGCDTTPEAVEFGAEAYHFMDFSVAKDVLYYQAIDEDGRRLHSGKILKRGAKRLVDIAA